MRRLRPTRMWWHRHAVVEVHITARTYRILSWHTTHLGALNASLRIVEHFDETDNISMLSTYEFVTMRAHDAERAERLFPASTRILGARYAR